MTLSFKDFADGQLSTTKATLYTGVSGSTNSARVILTNTSTGSTVKVNLYLSGSGTSRRLIPRDMEMDPQDNFVTKSFEFEDGDLIEGDANIATTVDYTITGILRN